MPPCSPFPAVARLWLLMYSEDVWEQGLDSTLYRNCYLGSWLLLKPLHNQVITTCLSMYLFVYHHSIPAGTLCILGPISSEEQFTDTEQFSWADLGTWVIWACPGSPFVSNTHTKYYSNPDLHYWNSHNNSSFTSDFYEDFIMLVFSGSWFLVFI